MSCHLAVTDSATTFRSDIFMKFYKFYYETGVSVLLTTLKWLFTGPRPLENHLLDEINKSKLKFNNKDEKTALQELKENKEKLKELDLTLLYKIIQNVCGLLPRDNEVWHRACPESKKENLEYLLFVLKDGRNDVSHPNTHLKNLSDENEEDKCNEMEILFTNIIKKAGEKGRIENNEIEYWIDFVKTDIKRICGDETVDPKLKEKIKRQMKEDLKETYGEELKSWFSEELKGYSAPHFVTDLRSRLHLRQILKFTNSEVIIVKGEAGDGKTALTRYLFELWLNGNTDCVDGLSDFEVTIPVGCGQIYSRDISQFLESQIPNANPQFPNSRSLKTHLNQYKVLWIMDGFDESTNEFKGFLSDLTNSLSKSHKIIITTRPTTYEDLNKRLSARLVTTLSLEKLQDNNIEEIVRKLITNETEQDKFRIQLHSLIEFEKELLRTPLCITLYIKLWLKDSFSVQGPFNNFVLLRKTSELQFNELLNRLKDCTNFKTESDLKFKVNQWFYGSLCKHSFRKYFQSTGEALNWHELEDLLKGDANEYLNASDCLSSFLVEQNIKGKHTYVHRHPLQMVTLANLFVQNLGKRYCKFSLKNIVGENVFAFKTLSFIYGYMQEMIGNYKEDLDYQQLFLSVKKVINLHTDYKELCQIWYSLSNFAQFPKAFMLKVSKEFEKKSYFDASNLPGFSNISKFLNFINISKIRLCTSSHNYQREGFADLLNYFELNRIEIMLYQPAMYPQPFFETINLEKDKNLCNVTSEFDAIKTLALNITAFGGTVNEFFQLKKHHKNFNEACIIITSEDDLFRILKFLRKSGNSSLKKSVNLCYYIAMDLNEILQTNPSRISKTGINLKNLNKIKKCHNQLVASNFSVPGDCKVNGQGDFTFACPYTMTYWELFIPEKRELGAMTSHQEVRHRDLRIYKIADSW